MYLSIGQKINLDFLNFFFLVGGGVPASQIYLKFFILYKKKTTWMHVRNIDQ